MFELLINASIISAAVLKRHFFNNVKFLSAIIASLQASLLIVMGFDGRVKGNVTSGKMVFDSCK